MKTVLTSSLLAVALAATGSALAETRSHIGTDMSAVTAPKVVAEPVGIAASGRFVAYSRTGTLTVTIDAPARLVYTDPRNRRVDLSVSTAAQVQARVAPALVVSR